MAAPALPGTGGTVDRKPRRPAMIVVEFRTDPTIFRRTLARNPETAVEWERSNAVDGERVRALVWATGGDLDAFEANLLADPTVRDADALADVGGRRLFQVELDEEGLAASVYPHLVEVGGIVESLTGTDDGWEFRVRFPKRGAVDRFFDACREQGADPTVRRLYEERATEWGRREYGMTEPQREALLEAVRVGYFDVPREAGLQELGTCLGISDTAASQRLRRGMKTLVEHTLRTDAGSDLESGPGRSE